MSADRDDGLVYDVGMHDGEDTEFYLRRGFRVVGIEANPVLVARLREKFGREIRTGRLVLVDRAIARAPGQVLFAVNRTMDVWGSIDADFIERNRKAGAESDFLPVEAVRFADVVRAHGIPYYLKIDIEGMDMACVEGLWELAAVPKYLSIESAVTSGNACFDRGFTELAQLWSLGYRQFKYVDQSLLERLDGKLLQFEGDRLRYTHVRESSGPFGEDSPGEWSGIKTTLRQMRRLIAYQNTIGFGGRNFGRLWSRVGARMRRHLTGRRTHSWYDLHARLEDVERA